MPKTKTSSSVKKRFKVTGAGKILRRRDFRTSPPGHLVKRKPGKRRRVRRDQQVAPSDRKTLRKLLGGRR